MLVVGSTALRQHVPSTRHPKDLDIICTIEEADEYVRSLGHVDSIRKDEYCYHIVKDRKSIELFLAREGSALMDYLYMYDDILEYAPLNVLYSMKLSHIHYPTKMHRFEKHVRDLCVIHEMVGGMDVLKDITQKLVVETEARLGKIRTPKLTKSSKDFFEQSKNRVVSVFIHDSIHRAMAR